MTIATLKPIQTRYAGHHFRSRLEARWAVAFDSIKQSWDYEPEGFDLDEAGFYLPDFWLPQVEMWAEVKPTRPNQQEIDKASSLAERSEKEVLFLISKPAACAYWAIDGEGKWMDYSPFDWTGIKNGRFYVNCGLAEIHPPMPTPVNDQELEHIEAALSARFEHGESGAT